MSWNKREDLKTCPFCGNDAEMDHEHKVIGSHVKCTYKNCPMSTFPISFDDWQNRAKVDTPPAGIKGQLDLDTSQPDAETVDHNIIHENGRFRARANAARLSLERTHRELIRKTPRLELVKQAIKDIHAIISKGGMED